MIPGISCYPLLAQWAQWIADAWEPMSGPRRSARLAFKGCCMEAKAAASRAVPMTVSLHSKDPHLEDLATAGEYPHRFNVRTESALDQVEWLEKDEGNTPTLQVAQHRLCSAHSRDNCYLQITNSTTHTVRMLWLDYQGNEVAYEIIRPGDTTRQQTFLTHPWVVREVTTCTRLLLNGREAFIPTEQEHKEQVARLLARQQAQQQMLQQQQSQRQLASAPGHAAAPAGEPLQQQQQQQQQGAVAVQPVHLVQLSVPLLSVGAIPVLEVHVQELPQLKWTKETHSLFPAWFKASIRAFLLSHLKQHRALVAGNLDDDAACLAELPTELLPHITGLAAPVVPQGVHYPPHGRRDIKPARLPAAPAAPEQEQPQEQLQDEQDND